MDDPTQPTRYLSTTERISELGALGEVLAAEWLTNLGCKCTPTPRNYPFADIIGSWNEKKYFIGVKTRNEKQMDSHEDNNQYNIVGISDAKRRALEQQGKSKDDITRMLWEEVWRLASTHNAAPAWVTVSVRATTGIYSAYFGVVSKTYSIRSVRMTPEARRDYKIKIENVRDARITPNLLNTRER